MKFIVVFAIMCAFVATGLAQTKSPNVEKMQYALGDMLAFVKDLTVATNAVISDINVQAAMKDAKAAIAGIRNLYGMYSSTYTNSVPLAKRTKVNNALTTFKTNIDALETGLNQFPTSPANLTKQIKAVHDSFFALGGSVVPL